MKKLLSRIRFHIIRKTLRPVFIVGCGHSGTSIMLSLFDNHSDVYAIKYESKVFFKKDDQIIGTFLKWHQKSKSLNKKIIIEKTPTHIHKLDKMLTLFPKAKVILMLRDGRDVACSIRERSGNFHKGIERWIEDNSEGYKFWNNDRVKVVKLEKLTEEPNNLLSEICAFIEIKYESNMIEKQGKGEKLYYTDKVYNRKEFEDKEPSLEIHSARRNWQINQELFSNTNRWKKEFSSEDLEVFNERAEGYLELYGYDKNDE